MESTVRERIEAFLKDWGLRKKDFCEAVGVGPAYVTNIRKSVSDAVRDRIEKAYPQLNMDWLIYGRGEMLNDTSGSHLREAPDNARIAELETENATLRAQVEVLKEIIRSSIIVSK